MALEEQIIGGIILMVVSGVGGYIINEFRIRTKQIKINKGRIIDLQNEVEQLKRILISVAKKIDRQTKRAHPEADVDIEDIVRDFLTEEFDTDRGKCAI